MTTPTHPLVKELLDVTREIMRQTVITGQSITPPPETILATAQAKAEQERANEQ